MAWIFKQLFKYNYYEKFKTLAGGIGEEFVRSAEVVEMPDDMMPGMDEVPAYDGEPAV